MHADSTDIEIAARCCRDPCKVLLLQHSHNIPNISPTYSISQR